MKQTSSVNPEARHKDNRKTGTGRVQVRIGTAVGSGSCFSVGTKSQSHRMGKFWTSRYNTAYSNTVSPLNVCYKSRSCVKYSYHGKKKKDFGADLHQHSVP